MKTVLKLEEVAMLGLSVYGFAQLNYAWWWYLLLFFLPDLGFVGYVFNSEIGAWFYNILHHRAVAVLLFLLGIYLNQELFQLLGIVMFGHAAFDRILGYGLKYADSFYNTHLGLIGKLQRHD